MKKVAIILSLLSILSACVFNIKLPPEDKEQKSEPPEPELVSEELSQKFQTILD